MGESNFITIQDCDVVIKKYLKTEKVKTLNFSVVRLQNKNFLIKIIFLHKTKENTLNFYAKSSLSTPKINQILFNDLRKTLPDFDEKITPKLYYARSGLLLFEDLTCQGFQIHDSEARFFDLDHIKIVLKVLAKFHAGSFAYEEIKSEETQKVYRLNHEYKLDYYNTLLTKPSVIALVSSLLDDKSEDNLKKTIELLQNCQSSQKYRRTLCHGNLIAKNVMFRYVEGVPVECKLISFKSMLYASPIYDVLQLIFFNTSKDFRQHHFHSLLSDYYISLEEEFQKYSLKINSVLSRGEWQNQSHQFLPLIKLECVLRDNEILEELKEDLNCPLLSRQDCYAIIKNKLKTTNYQLLIFKVKPLSSGGGFLGDYRKLHIKVRHENKEITINCFVKRMPVSPASKEVVQDSNGFNKEAFVYEILVAKFKEFGIDIIDDCLPACYFQRAEDIIVLEDMAALGYRVQAAQDPYDFDTLCVIVRKLAKLHASAFIYEEQMSEKLKHPYRLNDEYEEYFREAIIVEDENHSGGKLMATGVRSMPDAANLFPEIKTKENEENFNKFLPELTRLFYSTLTASERFRNVVSHGDLWSSNILIRFEDGKAIDCRFIDFQLLRYCPPGHDLLSILHLTTLREIRMKHEEDLLKVYYEELTHLLKSYNYSITKVLPYEDFLGGVDYMKPEMVLQAPIYCMLSMSPPEEISLMLTDEEESNCVFFEDRKEFLAKMCSISPIYKSRLRDRIQDVYDYCKSMSK